MAIVNFEMILNEFVFNFNEYSNSTSNNLLCKTKQSSTTAYNQSYNEKGMLTVRSVTELQYSINLWSPSNLICDIVVIFIEKTIIFLSKHKILNEFKVILLLSAINIFLAILATAFLTLKERSILAAVQLRKGPNKVSYGYFQPIADALKLLLKEFVIPNRSYKFIFIYIASFGFICSSCVLLFVPFNYYLVISNTEYNFLFIFFFNLMHIYAILLSGWSSKSKYSFLGAVRTSSQLISYDIGLALVIAHVFCYVKSLSLINIIEYQVLNGSLFYLMPVQFIFFIIIGAAETSRHPFDLPEAEPELVSGYNVEYSAIRFALFFLSEYLSVILFSNLVVIVFLGGWTSFLFFQSFEYILKISLILIIIIKLRAVLPRYRVDQLMRVCWKFIIPFELLSLIFTILTVFMNV